MCHGLAGFFEATLFEPRRGVEDGPAPQKVELSTRPDTIASKSDGMVSWFPIFFPLKVCVPCCLLRRGGACRVLM